MVVSAVPLPILGGEGNRKFLPSLAVTNMQSARKRLPAPYLQRMAKLLGSEYTPFVASYAEQRVDGLRVNELKVGPQAFVNSLPVDVSPVEWCPSGFTIPSDTALGHHPYHAAGLYYLQEPSAMAVTEVLAPRPGERVLDLCAAPGGKATHIASLMRGQGLLVANDIHRRRVRALAENVARWGATNAAILNEKPDRLARRFPAFFDRALVDAPCSGEAMFRRSESACAAWSVEHVRGCAMRQQQILASAAPMIRPGGWLCYATCTFSPEENEGVVASFLRDHPDFDILEVSRFPGFERGHPEWVETTQPLERAVRLWPHRAPGDGHFIALMQRTRGEVGPPERTWAAQTPPDFGQLSRAAAGEVLADFCRKYLALQIEGQLSLAGSHLYRLPPDLPDLSGLRVVRTGWWLGRVGRDRLEPSHALAMALHREEARLTLDLSADGPEVCAYLQGRPLHSRGEDGWLLVTVDGHPLGWGKRVRGEVKNHYPRRLRWR